MDDKVFAQIREWIPMISDLDDHIADQIRDSIVDYIQTDVNPNWEKWTNSLVLYLSDRTPLDEWDKIYIARLLDEESDVEYLDYTSFVDGQIGIDIHPKHYRALYKSQGGEIFHPKIDKIIFGDMTIIPEISISVDDTYTGGEDVDEEEIFNIQLEYRLDVHVKSPDSPRISKYIESVLSNLELAYNFIRDNPGEYTASYDTLWSRDNSPVLKLGTISDSILDRIIIDPDQDFRVRQLLNSKIRDKFGGDDKVKTTFVDHWVEGQFLHLMTP